MIFLLLFSTPAYAEPISGFIAILTAVGSAGTAGGVFAGFAGLTGFLATPFGNLLLAAGLTLISNLFLRKTQQPPSTEGSRINVKIPEGERWITGGGDTRNGGAVVFGEFDKDGNFWYVIVHSDSILVDNVQHIFDEKIVEIDADGWVTTNAFCLDDDRDVIDDDDVVPDKLKYFGIFTTTYTETNPVPPPIPELMAAFPGASGWTTDHKLVGTTYSAVKCRPVSMKHRFKVLKWRGPFGTGEPSLSIVGRWSNMYDPRDPTQVLGNRSTYKPSSNSSIVWAWFRTHPNGRNKPESDINWTMVAREADRCDEIVLDLYGEEFKRWQTCISVPDSKERNTAEQEILISCDGQLVFDDDGKTWMRVGYYDGPALTLSRNRDIFAMESREAQDGEMETQGCIVRYIEPEAIYITQPSAPYQNPDYYTPGVMQKYITMDVLACPNHNQAMRLAKSFAKRSQARYKLLPVVGLRGLRCRKERIFDLRYDNVFSGDHEIVSPVEVDERGASCSFGVVPINPDRWTLLLGEEKPKPAIEKVLVEKKDLAFPQNLVLELRDQNRLYVTFDPPSNENWEFEFDIKLSSETEWLEMVVDMDELLAYSFSLLINQFYQVRYRTVDSNSKASPYIYPYIEFSTFVLMLTGTPVTSATVDSAYAGFNISVSGGQSPYLFVDIYNRLPPGITVNPSTGNIAGTPTVDGTFSNIIIRVSDANNAFRDFAAFTITVAP